MNLGLIMRPLRSALTIFIAVGVSACSPQLVKMDQSTRDSLKQVLGIKVISYAPPTLFLPPGASGPWMALGPVGGVIGGLQNEAKGRQITKDSVLQDPTIRVRNSFLSLISKELNPNTLTVLDEALPEDNLDKIRTRFPEGTILDFRTVMWGISTVPLQGYHYVLYSARGRLIDLSQTKLIWQGFCRMEDKDPKNMPHWTQFTENNGEILKEKLNNLATSCADELAAQFLNQPATK